MAATLHEFLEARRVTHANWNLTGMSKHVGKYKVADDEYGDFLRLYHEYVFDSKKQAYLLERHSPMASPILIDLDFRYPLGPSPLRQFTHDNIAQFVTQYAAAVHRFIVFDAPLRFYVQQIPAPLVVKDQLKDGIHIICPDIALKYEDLFALRKYTLENAIVESSFAGLANPPADCFDESVIQRNNWFLYGSTKSADRVPYAVTTCFVLEPDGSVAEEHAPETPMELVCTLSIRVSEPSQYTIRPDMVEEWTTWKSICDKKPTPKKPVTESTDLVSPPGDADSVSTHMSDHISKIIKQPGLVWDVAEVDDGYKLTHNSKRCLVATDTEHSTLGHSCVFVTEAAANLVCFSHKSKRLPKQIATALWNMLANKIVTEDELTARYKTMKVDFEKKTFRILDPPGYMAFVNGKWIHYTRPQLIDMNSGMFVDDDKKCRYIDQWLKDDSIRTYASMDYYVDPHECPPDVYNKYDGFVASHLPITQGDITPILDHVNILCNHEPAAVEFLLDWFSQIVQTPWNLIGIAVVIMGTHGCGKDILMTWFGSQIVGMDNYHKTSRPHIDLFSSFNSSRKNAIFYHIEEGNSEAIQPNMVEQFKNYITDPYSSIQMKNVNTTTLSRNYNHFALTTNKKVPFHIEKTERRMFAIRASSEKCHNQSYFLRLSSAMTDNNVVRSFYDFLMTRDITGRDWCNPPITVALQSWKTECMPRLEPFIDYFKANNETPCEVLSSRLYTLYLEWCELMDEESLTVTSFGLEMKHINFISKGRNTNGIFYKFI
jgi:hypothetical protein